MAERRQRVLVVDDDPLLLEMVQRTLTLDGFVVATVTGPIGVSNLIRSNEPDFVLLDVDLPAVPGERLLEVARRQAPQRTLFILYSSCDPSKLKALAEKVSADGWISKSTVGVDLARALHAIRAQRRRRP